MMIEQRRLDFYLVPGYLEGSFCQIAPTALANSSGVEME